MTNRATMEREGRACLAEVKRVLDATLEMRKQLSREEVLRADAERRLAQAASGEEMRNADSRAELARVLRAAEDVAAAHMRDDAKRDLQETVDRLRMELQVTAGEGERAKDRLKEALVSVQRLGLQNTQLTEELELCRQQLAKAERNVLKEARRASAAQEERDVALRKASSSSAGGGGTLKPLPPSSKTAPSSSSNVNKARVALNRVRTATGIEQVFLDEDGGNPVPTQHHKSKRPPPHNEQNDFNFA